MEEQTLTPKTQRKGLVQRMTPVIAAGLVLAALMVGGVGGSAATFLWIGPLSASAATSAAVPERSLVARQVEASATETNITAMYKAVSPAVVSITAVTSSSRSRSFSPQRESGGTGFIVTDQGYVLTNYHLIQGASSITIALLEGTKVAATVAGSDPGSDLALLKADIPKDKIIVAQLGDSDKVEPGQLAIAIGSPFGLDHTVTSGVVSGVDREFGTANGRPMRGLIQTDAPINPGNSGGPLFNANGEVVGITSSIESPVQGSVGIGFAIPINRAKGLLPQLQSGQKVEHPYLGITGTAITADTAKQGQLPVDSGVWVIQVVADGPAARAGLKGGDSSSSDSPVGGEIITEVDGKAVKTVPELTGYLDTKSVGERATLTIIRDGQTIKVEVTLGAWPAAQQG